MQESLLYGAVRNNKDYYLLMYIENNRIVDAIEII